MGHLDVRIARRMAFICNESEDIYPSVHVLSNFGR